MPIPWDFIAVVVTGLLVVGLGIAVIDVYKRQVYGHYYYGYPFYVTSALAILPLRAAAGFAPLEATTSEGTTANMLILRQLSPLFMVVGVLALVYCWTGFEHLGRSLLALLLLLTAPAVFDNNLWWHPESLTLLFVALTILALYRDNLRFGRWFVFAAVACGLAAGTKQAGFWFFLTIAVYLVMRWRADGARQTLKRGLLFAGVMALAVVVSNPLLLSPSIAREIVNTQMLQAQRIALGWDTLMPVSYTHLDVYKRQSLCRGVAAGRRSVARVACPRLRRRNALP